MGLDTEEEYVDEELPPIRLVICREDLPENPRWREYKYPEARCWDVYELFLEAKKRGKESLLWQDARRIWWECLPPFEVVPALVDGHFTALPIERIAELFRKGHDIRVLSISLDRCEPEYVKVLGVKEYDYNGYLARVVTHYGKEIIATLNHVIPVKRGAHIKFIPISEVRRGDKLITDIGIPIPQGNELPIVPPEVAELTGYILSEGYDVKLYTKKYHGKWHTLDGIYVSNKDPRIRDRIYRLAKGLGIYAYSRPKDPERIRLGVSVKRYLRGIGLEEVGNAEEKMIPTRLFWLPKEDIAKFLTALYSGDGCVKPEGRGKYITIDYATKSHIMSQQLYWLLRYLGFEYIYISKERSIYRLKLRTEKDILRFLQVVRFKQEEKNRRLEEKLREGQVVREPTFGTVVPVRKIELVKYKGRVYDLAVDKTHIYYAGFGILVHNSYWRAVSRYRRGRPFWRVYECDVERGVCRELPLTEDVKKRVMMEINIAGFETGVVPRGAGVYPWRPYKE